MERIEDRRAFYPGSGKDMIENRCEKCGEALSYSAPYSIWNEPAVAEFSIGAWTRRWYLCESCAMKLVEYVGRFFVKEAPKP